MNKKKEERERERKREEVSKRFESFETKQKAFVVGFGH
jgi:hypothetical protein